MRERYRHITNPFVRACAENDLTAVRAMLDAGEDPDQSHYREWVDPEFPEGKSVEYDNGIYIALREKNLPLLQMLCEAGASPFFLLGSSRMAPLMSLTRSDFVGGLRYLVDRYGIDRMADAVDMPKEKWIMHTVERAPDNLPMMKFMVEELGLDPLYRDADGRSAFRFANSPQAHPCYLEYIYSCGAKPELSTAMRPGSARRVVFTKAAKKDIEAMSDESFAKFEQRQDIARRYLSDSTALNAAVFAGDVAKVGIHLKYGADPLDEDAYGTDAFDVLEALEGGSEASRFFYKEDAHAKIRDILETNEILRPWLSRDKPKPKPLF